MKLVFKKFLGVFKSKFILVPVSAIGLVAIGAAIGWFTIKDPAAVASTNVSQPKSQSSYFGNRGDSLTGTLGESTPGPDESSSSSSTSKKPKSNTSNNNSNSTSDSSSTTSTDSCNQTQKASFIAQYNQAIGDENNLTNSNVDQINLDPGAPDYNDLIQQEQNRHQNAIGAIYQTYQQNLASIGC